MKYNTCKDFVSMLKSGDKLDFKLGETTTGSFSVADLPSNDAVLLLIVQRHDAHSTAVAFESHVFANLPNAQVAVIDAFKGTRKGMPRIKDAKANKKASRAEDLRYDSVVAISPGLYDVVLTGANNTEDVRSSLVALDHESYVVLRTGTDDKSGMYAENLVVFPASDAKALPSAAYSTAMPGFALLVAVLAVASVGA